MFVAYDLSAGVQKMKSRNLINARNPEVTGTEYNAGKFDVKNYNYMMDNRQQNSGSGSFTLNDLLDPSKDVTVPLLPSPIQR